MTKIRSKPYSKAELNKRAEQFRATQERRVHKFRQKKHSKAEKKSTKTDWWDVPLTVCSCGSLVPPFIATNGRNSSALKDPHSVLVKAYNNVMDNKCKKIGTIHIGQKPGGALKAILGLKNKDSYAAGRCAEPHAANRLIVQSGKISDVSLILFSLAFDSRYPIVKEYCVTCKCAFAQLR